MTINSFPYNADLNIYFHMKNHYKRLSNVKSTIDNSTPQGFRKSCPTPNNSPASIGADNCPERQARSCLQLSRDHNKAATQSNLHHPVVSQSETCVRSSSLPPRPTTRRHPFEMPQKLQCKIRSQSLGPRSRKDIQSRLNTKGTKKRRNSRRKNKDHHMAQTGTNIDAKFENDEASKKDDGGTRSPYQNKGKVISRTEEQEYLQFLLRITEDIIVNNYHTGEDVEKVFQSHVEANKGHLKMGKMKAQLVRLCGELNIPYNNNETVFKNEDCYQNFFENYCNFSCHQNFDNCECVTNRVLELEHRNQNKIPLIMQEDRQDSFILVNDMTQADFNMLMNKHSLSRVTECTEPCNSLDTLLTSTKHPSGTTVSSLGNVDALPGLESPNAKFERGSFEEIVGKILSRDISNLKEPLLTEKEKFSCEEEANIFKKYKDTFPIGYEDKYIDTIDFVTVIKDDRLRSDKPKDEEIPDNSSNIAESVKETETNLNISENYKKANYLPDAKVDKDTFESAQRKGNPTSKVQNKIEIVDTNAFKITYSKHTQTSTSCANQECNTSLKLNGYGKHDEYVLVNGPMYVLKTLLDSDERLILYNRPDTDDVIVSPPLENDNSSKLLNSDYDLTPEREVDSGSAKYHHLSVDATTSISNINLTKRPLPNLNYDGLLLTEGYAVNGRKEVEAYRGLENDNLLFSGYVLSSDGQYEIQNYTISHEVNRSVGIYSCSLGFQPGNENDQIIEQDVSIGQYEIYSQDDNLNDNYKLDANEDGSEREVKAKDKMDDQGSYRSENRQNLSKYPDTINILGKRKIKDS